MEPSDTTVDVPSTELNSPPVPVDDDTEDASPNEDSCTEESTLTDALINNPNVDGWWFERRTPQEVVLIAGALGFVVAGGLPSLGVPLEWARLFALAAVALPTADLVDELARHKLPYSNNTSTLLGALATIALTGSLLFPNTLAQIAVYAAALLTSITFRLAAYENRDLLNELDGVDSLRKKLGTFSIHSPVGALLLGLIIFDVLFIAVSIYLAF